MIVLFSCSSALRAHRFNKADNIKTTSPVRSSEQRAIRAQILQQYPALEEYVEDIFPKKESLIMCKWCVSGPETNPYFHTSDALATSSR